VVEWGERMPESLRRDALGLTFGIAGPERRTIAPAASGARGAELLEAWRADAPTSRSRS
jgi:tRNA A37 threonylcarbamoyladenosine biosynthesis protein TsaE